MTELATSTATAAFFDMDKTLLSDSSVVLMARYMRKRGELTLRDVLEAIKKFLSYKLGKLDMMETMRHYVAQMAGHLEADRIEHSRQWFSEQLIDYVTEEGQRLVNEHRSLGHRVALITASPSYTADRLAEHLGIPAEDVMATRLEVQHGRFTGRVVEPMVFGQGKLDAARGYADRYGIDLTQSYFYTDSIDDLPLLEKVGHPVAVNPDRALRKLAERSGWPIVQFY
ncbi:MAG: HAD family phosphatase [Anaerolineae bacterium]